MMKPTPRLEGRVGRVPPTSEERFRLRDAARRRVLNQGLVPPLPLEDLRQHGKDLVRETGAPPEYEDFLVVLLSNALWRDTVASVPCERRMLLLPQCLRARGRCTAEIDEFGLLCAQCGGCAIGSLQEEAERLGYVVLVAEGTTVVLKLIEQGRIDALIGVSCMPVLERAFPHTAAEAIPSLAIPLLHDGCIDSPVDLDWIRDALYLESDARWLGRIDLDRLQAEVEAWFEPEALRAMLIEAEPSRTADIGLEWLALAGKRWRPFLAACAYTALQESPTPTPRTLRTLAVAVECFHKASLIHDDIEDNDDVRYGRDTLHRTHGIPIALNVGDWLIGEGYRLIAACGGPAPSVVRMLAAAAEGHRDLCVGQGDDLLLAHTDSPPSVRDLLSIFRRKTAPAFGVALLQGALAAGADDEVCAVLDRFSRALGMAYQIHDDLTDDPAKRHRHARPERPLFLLAVMREMAGPEDAEAIDRLWREGLRDQAALAQWHALLARHHALEKAEQLYAHYKREAVRSLAPLRNAQLKSLLRRVVSRVLPALPSEDAPKA